MRRLKQIAAILTAIIGVVVLTDHVYALTYQDSDGATLTFTYNSTLTMSVGDSVSISVAPGQQATSSVFNVKVATNCKSGYKLTATMGDGSTYTNANLTGTNGSFSPVTAGNALSAGYWGYKTSSSATTYNPIAYRTATATTIATSSTPTDGTSTGVTTMYFGAYAASTQAAGNYTNVINFSAVANAAN